MKNLTTPPNADSQNQENDDLLKKDQSKTDTQSTEKEPIEFNQTLLSSLPYPAMYIRQKDRVVIAANNIALSLGAKIGEYCWRSFTKKEYISDNDFRLLSKFPDKVPEKFNIQCVFCQGDQCIFDEPCQNNPELKAFGKFWNTYWIKVSEDVFLHYLIDITESKMLEESLRESELFLKQTQQIAMLGTYKLDVLTGQWQSSEILDEIFGIDTNSIKTFESWIEIVHPDWRKTMNDYFQNDVLKNKTSFNKEYKIIRQNDKRERWVQGLGDLIFDKKGRVTGMIGTIRDITERKKAEDERKYLLAAVENFGDRVVVKDLDLKIVAANKAWINSRGQATLADVVGKTDADVIGMSPDSEPINTYMEEERKAQKLSQGEYIQSENPLKLSTGENVIALSKTFPIFDEGGNLFCTGTLSTDITERKKMEETLRESEMFLRQTQQIAMLGTYTLDISSGHWVSSEVLDSIFGIDTNYDKTFESWIKIVHPDWRKTVTDFFMLEAIGIKTKFDKEYKIIRQNDKAERWVHGIGNIKFNDKNVPIKMIGTIRDITERKLAEEERNFLIAAIENSDSIIAVKDLNLRVVAANQAFVNASGQSSLKNIIGKTDAEIYGISPYFEPVRTYMEDDKKAQKLKPGEIILREEPLILPDGEKITILTRKYPIFDSEGKLFCTGSISTNISVLKTAEKALLLKNISFDTAIAANSITGTDGLITEVNEAFLRNFGYRNKEKVIGKTVSHFVNNAKEAREIITSLRENGQWEGDYIAKKEDGSTFNAHGLATAMHDKNGKTIGYQSSVIDITDRKQAEEALKESEQMLLTVLDHFPGVVFWKDKESNYLGCNQVFATAAGLNNPAEIVGKTDFELPWGKTEAENYQNDDYEVMEKEGAKLHIIETQHQADGKIIWFDTSKIPLKDDGNVIGVIGVSIDITDRKLAEDALVESEEKYRTVANYTDDWEYWTDQNDKFVYCSPSCERITGYKASEFIQNPELLYSIICPDDQKVFQKHKKGRIAGSCNDELQFRIISSNGAIRWIGHVCRQVFNDNGEFIGIRGSNRDITERKNTEEKLKHSERKYKLLSKNITDGVFTCRDGYIEYLNYSMSRIFGYEESELEGLELSQLIIPERRKDFETFISVESTTNQTNNIDIECVRKDDSTVFVEIFLNYVASEGLIYGVIHDITEKKLLHEKNIIKAIIQTEENERAHFSKELHDGLGPLLSTIKLYLQWSARPKSNKSRKEIILKAEEILEEALTAVKEVSNKLSPHLLSNYGLTSAVQSFATKLQETNTIKIDFQSNLSRRIEMETEVALYRAIIECVNNTIKYAHAKNIYIKINDAGNQLQLQYRDDGRGFDIVKILLEKKGLGLFNLQNRIQTIGGEIKMFSKPHEGVNYHINVPVKPSK